MSEPRATDGKKVDAYRKQAARTLANLRTQQKQLERALDTALDLYRTGTDLEGTVLTDIENMRHANGRLLDAIDTIDLLN